VVSSRQTLTQALLSDMVEPEFIDAGFSLYFLIGFVSIPFWTVATGMGYDSIRLQHRLYLHLQFLYRCDVPATVPADIARGAGKTVSDVCPRAIAGLLFEA